MDKNKLIKQTFFILLIALISGITYNFFSKNSIPYIYKAIEFDSGQVISLEKAYKIYLEGRALFVDTRTEEEYTQGHIKNAVNIPAHSSMDEIVMFVESNSKDRLVITYCDGLECSDSKRMAAIFMQIGFENVLIFFGGWNEWQKNNYPIEKGLKNENETGY